MKNGKKIYENATIIYSEKCIHAITERVFSDITKDLETIQVQATEESAVAATPDLTTRVIEYLRIDTEYRLANDDEKYSTLRNKLGLTNDDRFSRFLNRILSSAKNLIKKFQIVAVEFEKDGPRFWYVLFDCKGEDANANVFAYMELPRKDAAGIWNTKDVEDHLVGFSYPVGCMTTIHNWITQGGLVRLIRDFGSVENMLNSPLIKRPDLVEYFRQQARMDLDNLGNISRPLGYELVVYRGSKFYANKHNNIVSDFVLATSNKKAIAQGFAKGQGLKKIIISPTTTVADIRIWNPDESEVLLVPPVYLKFEKLGNPPELNEYILQERLPTSGGTRRSRRKSRVKTRKAH